MAFRASHITYTYPRSSRRITLPSNIRPNAASYHRHLRAHRVDALRVSLYHPSARQARSLTYQCSKQMWTSREIHSAWCVTRFVGCFLCSKVALELLFLRCVPCVFLVSVCEARCSLFFRTYHPHSSGYCTEGEYGSPRTRYGYTAMSRGTSPFSSGLPSRRTHELRSIVGLHA
jgi:hypothetical protein